VRRVFLLACLALVSAACGGEAGTSEPGSALSQTAAKLEQIKSGTLHLQLSVDPHEEGGNFGFELNGPFELAKPGKLPVAEIDYTQTAGGERETVTLTSTGERAYVTVDGTAYELPEDKVERLRASAEASGRSGGLEELRIDDWIRDATSSDGGDVGGTDTDKITAELDVVAAANDLIELAQSFGAAQVDPIQGQDAEQLRRAVQDSKIEVWTGDEDRLLRRLHIEADFDPHLPPAFEDLARAAGSKVTFDLELDNPNKRVDVKPPENPRPASELEN
jgi:hypothetical protein